MNALDRVRKRFGSLLPGTDITDKSPSVGIVSPSHKDSQSFLPANPASCSAPSASDEAATAAAAERAAILEYDAGFARTEAELRAAFPNAANNCARLVTCGRCRHMREQGAGSWCAELKTEVWPGVPFDCPSYERDER